MKLYIISGLGADRKVLEKLTYNPAITVEYLDWIIPQRGQKLDDYIIQMADKIDDSQPFYLMGYSFGGIIAQEIHKHKKAEKIVILGSLRSHKEKFGWVKATEILPVSIILPEKFLEKTSTIGYTFFKKIFDADNPRVNQYFRVKDPYYLKWSIKQIGAWKSEETQGVIQILGEKDFLFPPKKSNPDYIIKGGTHLFPATKHKELSKILSEIFI